MDTQLQTLDLLRVARRLSEQAGDQLLTYLIDLAIEQSIGSSQPSGNYRKVPESPLKAALITRQRQL